MRWRVETYCDVIYSLSQLSSEEVSALLEDALQALQEMIDVATVPEEALPGAGTVSINRESSLSEGCGHELVSSLLKALIAVAN
jgi:hypothetical protein